MPRTKKTIEEVKEIKPKKAVSTSSKTTTTKRITVKSSIKEDKEAIVEKPKATAKTKIEGGLSVELFDIKGKIIGDMMLPESIFAAKINKPLMSQAVRVYLANQRQGTHSTKSRGEVQGSTRKIYRQKGTGRARHGGVRAPIFVHGGIAHGPKPKDYSLDLTKNMRRAALFSALSVKAKSGEIKAIKHLSDIEMKTKNMANLLKSMNVINDKVLLILPGKVENVYKAARNIERVTVVPASQLHTYSVLDAKFLVLMEEAIGILEKTFINNNKS